MHLQVFNYSVQNQSSDTIDVHVDGDIVDSPTKELLEKYWGDQTSTSFKSFRDQITAGVKTLNVYVNSLGGHVGDAMAIHDYLKELESKGVTVNRKGRGIIASSGTYILMGNNSELSENSWFMIHNVSGFAYGDVNQVENQAKAMRKFNDRIVSFYANQTGIAEKSIGEMMNNETWFTAQEAKEKGFVKKVTGQATFSNSIKAEHWQFNNKTVLNAYNSFAGKKPTRKDSSKKAVNPKNRFKGAYEAFTSDDSKQPTKKNINNRFKGAYVPFKD